MERDGDRGGSSEGEQGFLFIDIPERPVVADFAKVYFRTLIVRREREREDRKRERERKKKNCSVSSTDNNLRLFPVCDDAAKYTTVTIA